MGGNLVTIQHSLNAGELSTRYQARHDQNKRLAGLAKCENWLPLTVGGVTRRPGSIYVATVKTVADHPIKIIRPFKASNEAAYALEFGHLYVRFYRNALPIFVSGSTPLEIVTPYTDTDLPQLYLCESVDVMYLYHSSYPTQKLSRTSATTFVWSAVTRIPPPTFEQEPTGTDLSGGTLTPAATTGLNILFTASATPFLASDFGRYIISGAGRAEIITVDTSATVHANIIDDFASTSAISAGNWRLKLSPQTPVDVEDSKKEIGSTAVLTATANAWRAADVGKYVSIFGGLVKITVFTSALLVTTKIIRTLKDITSSTPDPTRAWSLEVPSYSGTLGYPSCGSFFDERLWEFKGLTANASVTNDFENFGKGGGDDDAIQRTISDDDIDSVVWAKGFQTLLVGTGSGAFEIKADTEGQAVTPTNCTAKAISSKGAARIAPIKISGLIHYVQYGQRRLRELVFDFATNKYKSPNLFQLAEHLTQSFYITELCYAAEPDSLVYAVRSDGVLLVLVYQEEENVLGWAPMTTQGDYKSICAIPRPSTGKDWLWTIVSRENGTFVEYFEPDRQSSGRQWQDAQTDSAVFAVPTGYVVSGLDHLEGQTVRIIGDGMLFDDDVVVSGDITLSPAMAVDMVEVGLNYDSDGLTCEPVVPADAGGPFISGAYSEIGMRVHRSLGLTLNGEQMVYRKASDPMDAQVPLQNGKVSIKNLGFDPFNRVSFKQTLPFPAEVLNIVGKLQVGDRWRVGTEADESEPFSFIASGAVADIFTVDIVINSNKSDYNLYDDLILRGWNETSPVDCTVTINAGAVLSPSAAGSYGFDTGPALPPGSTAVVITLTGIIQGWEGEGGLGGLGAQNGEAGEAGGTALNIQYDVTIDMTAASLIRGGPGGGGGGGGGSN